MLSLNSLLPSPEADLHHLLLPAATLLLHASADAVVIRDAASLALVRVLAFWEAFPGAMGAISCISVDSGMKLIVASMQTRVAVWSLSGVEQDAWRLHSSLALPPTCTVTALDSRSGLLAVGSEDSLSVYTLILENDLPTWSQKWMVSITTPSLTRFAPSLMYIAATSKNDKSLRTYSTTSGRLTQDIPHPRPITNISWRHSQASSRDDLILYTITSDSTLRIFLPVLDSPQYLQLHASLDLFSSIPFSISSRLSTSSAIFWLDRQIIGDSISAALKNETDLDEARIRRLQEIKDEGWDLFLRVLEDGSAVVTAVANIDRRPPTLLRQFTLQQTLPSTFPAPPCFMRLLPKTDRALVTLITSSPLRTFELSPLLFLDGNMDGLRLCSQAEAAIPTEDSPIVRFVRTPEGGGVGVVRATGGDVWRVVRNGSRLIRSGNWSSADHIVVLDGGRSHATYSATDGILALSSEPRTTLLLPPISSLFSLPSKVGKETIVGITHDFSIVQVHVDPGLVLYSHSSLPVRTPKMILPVDPMAWGMRREWATHDVLLSVSELGELAFWVPDETSTREWRCTGSVRTHRSGISRARCSSAKKTALIVATPEGHELTIWDSKESEFASGLEFRGIYSDSINDLDWNSTPDTQSILAVGFLHHVELLCQQRSTYFDEGPGWTKCWTVEIGSLVLLCDVSSCKLTHSQVCSLSNQRFNLAGEWFSFDNGPPPESLFEHVARQNGPLEDFHPQMLLQCLLWEKVELVKDIIVNLARDVCDSTARLDWTSIPIENFLRKESSHGNASHKKRYTLLFNGPVQKDDDEEEGFNRALVGRLIETLETHPLPHLTPNEQAHLSVLIQTTLEIDEQRRALDANGLRYLISMRSFYILNRRASAPGSPESHNTIPRQTGRRERLRYRDMVWAFHSESQDLLLSASTAACNGKMCWSDARALGVSIWLKSFEAMKSHMEVIARNEFMAGDNRDPTACSLYYFALGKVKLMHGLWRQSAWHKEQAVMLKFLANDFSEPRWRTAALKNAYALLSKRRFEYAAAFFLLGGALSDAVNVCLKQLGDFQLAVALARVVEQNDEGPVLLNILNNTVIPTAFREGNRWLASWAFWLLHRRDLAVRILVTPLQDVADTLNIKDIGEPHYDDPSLALLFSQLRSKTLQAAKGSSEISGRAEFNFVLQIARVFCRMGCHVLALDLVRSWTFNQPSMQPNAPSPASDQTMPPSPTVSRRPTFALGPAMRRRSSMVIDMDIPSLPPTRSTSPVLVPQKPPVIIEEPGDEEADLKARNLGLGNLMKSAKRDVNVPEFDMNAFL
ncbi:RAVE protein 1 C terminal-domain-containing protein [Mycena belliarum]|uniref:RAVE protein 1 C terminal-domain-containing protein n=1 Tax=Mycena belliarum TaxID=1033014 RepID=A0AAD6XKF7_9AGAR|nr:RAVE protein 1 C terminal-domain-containing protein [Mycena belliae]